MVPHGTSRHTLEDNIKIDVKEVGWESENWIQAAQDRV
jgi:hypothetical protein